MNDQWLVEAAGHSAVGRQALDVDWEATSLGSPELWPEGLRHAVRLCFSTRFPVLIAWGTDLALIYNDGYRDLLGADKHPGALGAPVRQVWPEIWDDIAPLFDKVLSTGAATWNENMPLTMRRHGFDEETYFTFSYSALRDDDGQIAGVLDIVTETTVEVINQRRLVTIGELQAALPTTFTGLHAFAQPIIEVLTESADIARAAFYANEDIPKLVLETGSTAGDDEVAHVERALLTGQRETIDGTIIKPLRNPAEGRLAGVLVLQAATGRPWDRDYTRYLIGLASTIGAALRDAVRLRTTIDALRQRAQRSEAETARVREIALELQHAVLTEPPEPDHLEVAVHYQPAAIERDIGGDWYDAFVTPDGATTLVIGDVVGHDITAAATMGQLRGLVRAIGFDSGQPPANVMQRVDTAIHGLNLGTRATATAIVARIEQSEDQRRRQVRTVRWSSAGHLPPMVVRADGTVETLTVRNDIPLGLMPVTERTDHAVELKVDDTLVLYTDGLIERRDQSILDGLDHLACALADTHALSPDKVVQTVLSRLLPDEAGDDDVAIVAVRTGPEDVIWYGPTAN